VGWKVDTAPDWAKELFVAGAPLLTGIIAPPGSWGEKLEPD
jgi:hypothetical protein